ncbi:MAG: A/G-specific adenine glycosylase [Myxococcota bacterium]
MTYADETTLLNSSELSQARADLLRWYSETARDLPWRRTKDPYAIWVSEVMLQQTRVDTVIPYFERFMKRFPNAAALASASEDEVLGQWSGLGYYRRARLLHRGVQEVVQRYGGAVPLDAKARQTLPGIGRYTCGAIGSIAFDFEEPIVDGNVARVLARIHDVETPLGQAETEKTLWRLAERWVQGERPGALNQGLMELGATVCRVKAPLCMLCPIREACQAFRRGKAEELPRPRQRKAPKKVGLIAAVVVSSESVLLARGGGALFGGLWGVPMDLIQNVRAAEGARSKSPTLETDIASLLAAYEIQTNSVMAEPSGSVLHLLTHRKMDVQVVRVEAVITSELGPETRWVSSAELRDLGISTLTKKVLAAARCTSFL